MEFYVKVKEDLKITSLTEIDMRSLAEIRDEKDTFLTVYFGNTGRDRDKSFVASRLGAIKKLCQRIYWRAFQETLGMVEAALSAPGMKGERGRVICLSHRWLKHVYRLSVEPEPLVVWTSSPFLLPLAGLRKSTKTTAFCSLTPGRPDSFW